MRLALALGRTAQELEETLSEREWIEWEMFQRAEPIGMERDDWRLALLTAHFVNAHRPRNSPASTPAEFVFLPERQAETAPPPESLADIARAWGAVV
jgi:hypothetical protein